MTKEMENKLLNCRSLSEFTTMFFGLGMREKLSLFTKEISIPKGTCFYRIRRENGIVDPNNPQEWEPVPETIAKQGRFNARGESVLYIASLSDFLEREVRLNEGETYYLAKYICHRAFKVGTFLGKDSQVNTLIHKIAMAVSCAEDFTPEERRLIQNYYSHLMDKSPLQLSADLLAPLYLYNELPRLYDVTNKLGRIIFKAHECGIRYMSAYFPIEMSGLQEILTFEGMEKGNYVLTRKGSESITFDSVEKKTAGKPQELNEMITELAVQQGTVNIYDR